MRDSTSDRRALRGFTLTEVLVAIAIFAIIFVAALLVYDRSNRVFNTSMQAGDLQQETRVAFDTLVADLRMAGFDYNRDGAPMGANAYEQPDEQLEFIHNHAITFRANLDYETDAANDHGREEDYEPGSSTPADETDDFFPLVTTGNDEIVTYALVSESGANDDSITFYADVAKPRESYPGGSSETLVTIPGVDLCEGGCNDPPYTLYRITLDDAGDPVKTPLASNIRSLTLEYYSDAQQAAVSLVTPNEGEGQYTVSATSNTTTGAAAASRSLRSSIQSIRMRLVGMNPNEDQNYTSAVEGALPEAERVALNYRQYDLETTIVPRNLGRSGMAEFPTTPPGDPEVTNVCQQGCGVVRVEWKAPAYGTVDSYAIIWDTASNGAYGSVPVSAGGNLFGFVGGLDPTQTYFFKVVAKNSYGTERSANYGGGIQPKNPTQPAPPMLQTATGDGTEPAQENDITITFQAPQMNVPFNGVDPVNSCGDPAGEIASLQENDGYQVMRSTIEDFDPDTQPGTIIFNGPVAGAADLTVDSSGNATFVDRTAKLNCTPYHYRVRVKEGCAAVPALNTSGDADQAFSAWSDPITGEATASANPAAPTNLNITTTSTCIGAPGDPSSSCAVNLLWDRVTEDIGVNGEPASPTLVNEYEVRRVFAPSGFEDPDTEQIFTVTDPTPDDTGQMSWINETASDPSLIQPELGDRYHYYVRAKQCGDSFVSQWSSPMTKFPCAIVTASIPSPGPLDGDGVTSPYLIYANNASITLQANAPIDEALIAIYDSGNNVVPGGAVTHTAGDDTAVFNIPMDTELYRVEMTMIDQTGCGTTVVRFFQESFTNCCLLPVVNDATLIQESGGIVKVTLDNQCGGPLALNQFKVRWQSQNNGFQQLVSVTYDDGTVDNFGGVPKGTTGGGTILSTATIVVPAAASNVIPGSGTYTVTLTFQNDGQSAIATNIDFCAVYETPDDPGTPVTCSIGQSAGICTF